MKWTKLIRPRTFVVMITKAQRTIRDTICHGDFSTTKLCADLSSSKSSMSIAKRREFLRTGEDKVVLKRVSQKSVWPRNDCLVCNQNESSHWFLIFLTNIWIGFNFFLLHLSATRIFLGTSREKSMGIGSFCHPEKRVEAVFFGVAKLVFFDNTFRKKASFRVDDRYN